MSVRTALALALRLSAEPATMTFDHEAFCRLMHLASFKPDWQAGVLRDKHNLA
jgi:hypothetical protein